MRTVKSSRPLSMQPSYARSHVSKHEIRSYTIMAATSSRVWSRSLSLPLSPRRFFCFSYPILTEEHSQSRTLPGPSRKKKAKADKPVTIQEQRLAAALEVASSRSTSPDVSSPPPTHVAEQAALRAETIAAFHSGTVVQDADDTGDSAEEEEEEGGLFTLREKTRDEVEREEAEYRAYLEREVGPLEKILDIGEEEKTVVDVRRQEEDVHVPPDEADSGKKKRKKKGGKVVEEKVTDQEFLIKCVWFFTFFLA